MKEFFKKPIVIGISIFLGVVIVLFAGKTIFDMGRKNALQVELANVNVRLQQTSARGTSDEHLKLLARRQAILNALEKI